MRVPDAGVEVALAATGNMSTGGFRSTAPTKRTRTTWRSPRRLPASWDSMAGIDFICPDIAEPVRETGGGICEVNAAPGFRMHTHHGR